MLDLWLVIEVHGLQAVWCRDFHVAKLFSFRVVLNAAFQPIPALLPMTLRENAQLHCSE